MRLVSRVAFYLALFTGGIRHFQVGCRHCLLGGGPKLGFKIKGGAVGHFLTVSLSHDGRRLCAEDLAASIPA